MPTSKTGSLLMLLGTLALAVLGAVTAPGYIAKGDLPAPFILFVSWLPMTFLSAWRVWRNPAAGLLDPGVSWTFQRSRLETLAMLIGTIGFAIASYTLPLHFHWAGPETARLIGWVGVGFFGLGAVVFLFMLVKDAPRITLTPEGVGAPFLGIDCIRWHEIRGVATRSLLRAKYVALDLHDEAPYLARATSKLRRGSAFGWRHGIPPFSFSPSMFDTNEDELTRAINIRLRQFGNPGPTASGDAQRDPKGA